MIKMPAPATFAIVKNSSRVGLRVSLSIREYSLNFNGIIGVFAGSFANIFHFPYMEQLLYRLNNYSIVLDKIKQAQSMTKD